VEFATAPPSYDGTAAPSNCEASICEAPIWRARAREKITSTIIQCLHRSSDQNAIAACVSTVAMQPRKSQAPQCQPALRVDRASRLAWQFCPRPARPDGKHGRCTDRKQQTSHTCASSNINAHTRPTALCGACWPLAPQPRASAVILRSAACSPHASAHPQTRHTLVVCSAAHHGSNQCC